MNLPLQPDAFQTLQEQLMEFLRGEIRSGKFAPGDRLYSEAELKRMTGLSFVTIKRALAALAEEGLVVRRQGKGTFVKAREIVIRQSVSQLYSFVKDYSALGYKPEIALLSYEVSDEPKPDVLEQLELSEGERYYKLVRMLSLDGQPIGYEHNYLPERLFPGLTREAVRDRALYAILLEEYGNTIKHAKGSIQPVNLTQDQAERLHTTRGKAALLYCRTSYNQNGRPIEYTKAINRGDRYQFTYEIDC